MARKKSSVVLINDIMDELKDENNRLLNELTISAKYMSILTDLKTFFDLVSNKTQLNSESNEWQMFEDLRLKLSQIIDERDEQKKKKKLTNGNAVNHKKTNDIKLEEYGSPASDPKEVDINVIHRSRRSKRLVRPFSDSKPTVTAKKFVCEYPGCDHQCKNQTELKDHKKTHTGECTHECPECGKHFLLKGRFQAHLDRFHKQPVDPLICDIDDCGQEFSTEYKLNFHKWKAHKERKRFVCDHPGCGYRSSKACRLKDHKDIHRDDTTAHQCPQCEQTFATKFKLRGHIQLVHQQSEETLFCDICDKGFKSILSLHNHKRINHVREKRFVCPHENCEFKTARKFTFLVHITSHTTDRPFKCHIAGCGKTYKTEPVLNYHLKCHSNERNFVCPYEGCGKTFVTSENMRRHEKNNHSAVRYRCDWPGCEYSTRRKQVLDNHSVVHSGQYNFACVWPQCGRSFKTRAHLRVHLMIHKGDKRHACLWPGCHYRCVTSGNLKLHMKVHQKHLPIAN